MGGFDNSRSDRFEYVDVEHLQMKESARLKFAIPIHHLVAGADHLNYYHIKE